MEEQLLKTLTALKMEEASSFGRLCSEVYIENPLFWKDWEKHGKEENLKSQKQQHS